MTNCRTEHSLTSLLEIMHYVRNPQISQFLPARKEHFVLCISQIDTMMQFPYLFKLTFFKINIICHESVSFLMNDIINNYALSNRLHQEIIMFSWLHFHEEMSKIYSIKSFSLGIQNLSFFRPSFDVMRSQLFSPNLSPE